MSVTGRRAVCRVLKGSEGLPPSGTLIDRVADEADRLARAGFVVVLYEYTGNEMETKDAAYE
jgi:dienelactone hydrolase